MPRSSNAVVPTIAMLRTGEACIDSNGRLHLLAQNGRASARGKRAVNNGRGAEKYIATLNAACYRAGLARLRKVPTPTAGPNGKMRYIAKSGVDFLGMALRSGRHVAIEVKEIMTGRLPLEMLEPHQREELADVWLHGGIALLVVVHGRRKDVCVIPWPEVRDRIEDGDASIDALVWRVANEERGQYLARFV